MTNCAMRSPAKGWVASVVRWVHSFATAPALGGKAADDSPSARRATGRLVTISAAIFAFTATLLVLAIKTPADYTNLRHGFAALWPSYLAYAVTFLFIGQVWVNHHVMFDHIRVADWVLLLLNTLLLMIVAFLPFATSVLAGALRSGDKSGRAVAAAYSCGDGIQCTVRSTRCMTPLKTRGPSGRPCPC
jgi:hypothetical protein